MVSVGAVGFAKAKPPLAAGASALLPKAKAPAVDGSCFCPNENPLFVDEGSAVWPNENAAGAAAGGPGFCAKLKGLGVGAGLSALAPNEKPPFDDGTSGCF